MEIYGTLYSPALKQIDHRTMNYFRWENRYVNRVERTVPPPVATENKGESIRVKDRDRADERVAEIISGKHEEGRAEGRGQEAAWGVL